MKYRGSSVVVGFVLSLLATVVVGDPPAAALNYPSAPRGDRLNFLPTGKHFFTAHFLHQPPALNGARRILGNAVYSHILGTPGSDDRKLFEIANHKDWQYLVKVWEDGRWLVVASGEGEAGDKGLENSEQPQEVSLPSAGPAIVLVVSTTYLGSRRTAKRAVERTAPVRS